MNSWVMLMLIVIGSLTVFVVAIKVFKRLISLIISVVFATIMVFLKTCEVICFPIKIIIKNNRNKKQYESIF